MAMELRLEVAKKVEDRKVEISTIGSYSVKVVTYPDGTNYITVRKESREEYLPDIYCRVNDDNGDVLGFEIQTTSYGALLPEEIKKMVEALNEAVEIVEILTKHFVK